MKSISIVIPVYNSDKTIMEVVNRIISAFSLMTKKYAFEVILINDGSKDNSANICKNICYNEKRVKFINLAKNFGQLRAIMAGFSAASGDYIVCMDDDLQNPPEEIEKLVNTLENDDYDIVFSKYEEKKHSKFRNYGSNISDLMAEILMDKPKDIYVSSFFVVKRFIIEEVIKYDNPYPYLTGLFFRTTRNVGSVCISHNKRKYGKSGYNFKRLAALMFNGFTNFSVKPLRISSIIGAFLSGISFIWIIVLIIQKLISPNINLGWTSIMVAVIFFGGIQLLSIGLLGEYVGRIFMCINKTPQYVIREKYNFKDVNDDLR